MSDNKGENKNPENFWTTLPGILTGSAAVITAIAAVIGAINAFNTSSKNAPTSTQNPTSPPASQSSETTSSKSPPPLVVQANDAYGKPYYFNNQDKSAKIHFKAIEGQKWSVISPSNAEKWVKDCKVSTESISPDGLIPGNCKIDKLLCPNYKLGALVVVERNEDNKVKCLDSGAEGTFEMEKGQTVYFLMNDNEYNDNEGKVTVKIDYAN